MTSLFGPPPPLPDKDQSRYRIRLAAKLAQPLDTENDSSGFYDVQITQTLTELQKSCGKQVPQRAMAEIWQDADKDRTEREEIPADQHFRVFSKNGKLVCVVIRDALSLKDKSGQLYTTQLSDALRAFNLDYPPHAKTAEEKRHKGAQPDSTLQQTLLAGEEPGVFHIAEWAEQGRSGNNYPAKVSSETIEGQRKGLQFTALTQLMRFFIPAFAALAIFSTYIAPRAASIKNSIFDAIRGLSFFSRFTNSASATFTGTAVLFHLASLSHRDSSNSKHFLTEMIVVGDFHGGELYLEEWGLVVPYRSGDACLFYASSIPHAILPFIGRRYSLVNFTHAAAMNLISSPDFALKLKEAESFTEPAYDSEEYRTLVSSLKDRLQLAGEAKERQDAIRTETAAGVHEQAGHPNRHPGKANVTPPPLPPLASLRRSAVDGHYSTRL